MLQDAAAGWRVINSEIEPSLLCQPQGIHLTLVKAWPVVNISIFALFVRIM